MLLRQDLDNKNKNYPHGGTRSRLDLVELTFLKYSFFFMGARALKWEDQ